MLGRRRQALFDLCGRGRATIDPRAVVGQGGRRGRGSVLGRALCWVAVECTGGERGCTTWRGATAARSRAGGGATPRAVATRPSAGCIGLATATITTVAALVLRPHGHHHGPHRPMRPSVLLGLRLPSAGGGWLSRPARHRTRDDVRRPRSPPCDCGAATELRLRMMSAGAESPTGEVQILADCSCPALPALSVRPATCCRPPSMHMRSDSPPASLPLPAKYAPAATSGRPVPATPGSAPPGKRVATPKHGGTQTQGSGCRSRRRDTDAATLARGTRDATACRAVYQ